MKRIIHTKKFLALLVFFVAAGLGLGPSQSWAALLGGGIQGTDLNITASNAVVSTIAGSAGVSGSADETGTAARFNGAVGITSDGTNLYVADSTNTPPSKK